MMTVDARLLLVRHGQSTWDAVHRWAGQADPPLSETGRRQASELGRRLQAVDLDDIVSSDLRRAAETAAIVAEVLAMGSPSIDVRLRERHSTWSGLTSDEIEDINPGQLDAWRSGELLDLPGESETWEAFRERIGAALEDHVRCGRCTLVVAHAGVFRVVERDYGVPNEHVDNSAGRWLKLESGTLRAGSLW